MGSRREIVYFELVGREVWLVYEANQQLTEMDVSARFGRQVTGGLAAAPP